MNEPDPVQVRVALEPGPTPAQRVLTVTVTIADDYHVYAEPVPEGFTALAVTVEPDGAVAAGPAEWPPPSRLVVEDLPDEFWVYHGTVVGRVPIAVSPTGVAVEGEVVYPACTEYLCYLPASVAFKVELGH